MDVVIRADRDGDRARLTPVGQFNLPHAVTAAQAIANVERSVAGCRLVELDLRNVGDIDGTGAVQLGVAPRSHGSRGPQHAGPGRTQPESGAPDRPLSPASIRLAAGGPAAEHGARASRIDGQSLHRHLDERARCHRSRRDRGARRGYRGAKVRGLALASAARSGDRRRRAAGRRRREPARRRDHRVPGVSQLGRFGAIVYVPELVVVAHFRELGPLVTAIVVAGRSGAGLASELATMKVSEEIDAQRAMGFDPVRWLVVPRCLALVLAVPLLTWVGDVLALVGGWPRRSSSRT